MPPDDARSVASGPDGSLLGRLWYSDPTGQAAVQNILALSRADDLRVVDAQGNPIFLIRKDVLIDAVVPHLQFSITRRGRSNIRAHRKKAPAPVAAGDEGEVTRKGNKSS